MGNTSTESFPSEAPDGSGILDYMPRGIVARGYRAAASYKISNGEREILELSYDHFPGRAYRIHVSPWSVYGSNGAYIYLKAYVGYNGARPKMGENLLQVKTIRQGTESGNNVMFDMGTTWYDLSSASNTERRSYLFTFEALNGMAEVFGNGTDGSQFRVWVEDIGLAVPETGVIRSDFRSNGGAAPAPPTVIEPKNYSKTYLATGYRSYTSSGATYNYKTASMFQGQSPAGAGNLRSNAVFDSFTADLSGATITSVEAYFYFDHWYYNSGGTANIYLHADVGGVNSTIAPQTFAVSSSSWRAGTGRWVKIPSKFWNGFKTGEWRGVGLGGSGLSQYGYARGASTRIRIKYTK